MNILKMTNPRRIYGINILKEIGVIIIIHMLRFFS